MRARSGIVSAAVGSVTATYKDLADFGFTVESWTDALSGPARSFSTAAVPGRLETVKLAPDPAVKPGQIIVNGTVTGDTISDYLTNLRNLKGWAVRAVALKLLALDAATFVEVDQTEAPVVHLGIPGLTPATRVSITFQALKPYWQSTTLTSNTLTTGLTEQALGTAPVRPVIRFTGAPTGLTLTYADYLNTTVGTLTLSGLDAGATYTEIDMDVMSVVQMISGVLTNAIDTLDNATDFFALDPKDADTVTPTWPKLKYALAGGSVSGVTCSYRKGWY